jgi:uncharacterized membrane protein YphA (DoxX/SURF4 family)
MFSYYLDPQLALFIARVMLGAVMVYYGYKKVLSFRSETEWLGGVWFFKPWWFWGGIITVVELVGGLMILLGIAVQIPAALFGFQMLLGTIWKKFTAGKDFPNYSYDMLALGLCLVFVAMGPGAYALYNVLL